MQKTNRIFLAGHEGMIGSAIVRFLRKNGYKNIIVATKKQLDLADTRAVTQFFQKLRPEIVFLTAARVGGILANRQYPVEFLRENLAIQDNVISSCNAVSVKKLIFFACSCIYPAKCNRPMKESDLFTGPFERTNEAFAIAKASGLKLAQYFNEEYGLQCLNIVPCGIYGTNDSFDPAQSHVLSALVKRFVDAVDNNTNQVVLWGSGKAKREYMHVDDLVRAVFVLLEKWKSSETINVGSGQEISIRNLSLMIAKKVKYMGEIKWDKSKPDGMLRKCLDSSKLIKLGYRPTIILNKGIEDVIDQYKNIKNKI